MPYQLEYKRAVDSTWTVDSASLTAASFPRTIAGLLPGTAYNVRCKAIDNAGNSGAYSATSTVTTSASSTADWAARIAGSSVVWYHKFDTAAEVDKFRWAGGFGSGNDPLKAAPNANTVMSWQATGGPDGGPFMRLFRPAGTGVADLYYWVRPFSPLTAASNGRGVDDPAASATLPLQTFTPTSGGGETVAFNQKARPGWYGKAGYEAAGNYGNSSFPQFASAFDGNEFYLQVRVKAYADRMTTGNVPAGKFTNFAVTTNSHPNQELVTVSAWNADSASGTPSSPVGGPYQPNVHAMYEGAFQGLIGWGSNATGSFNYTAPKWAYSGGWDTLLYRIRPGSQNPSNPPFTYDTFIEVWAAHEGETTYTKIWDAAARTIFEETAEFDRYAKYAWNAFYCWIYQNNLNNVTSITQDFGQIIFSKAFIECPNASGATGTLQFTVSTQSQAETATPLVITVSRSGGSSGASSVRVNNAGTGTAVAGTDYINPGFPVTLNWTNGDVANKTVNVTLINRPGTQASRTLNLTLSNVTGSTLGTTVSQANTITDTPSGGTALATLAASMVPGQWAELTTNNLSGMTLPNTAGTGSSPFIEFTDKAVFDTIAKKFYVEGCARGEADGSAAYQCGGSAAPDAGRVVYDEATNTWSRDLTSPIDTAAHAYNHAAMNRNTGDYYYVTSEEGPTPRIYKRTSAGVYSTPTNPPTFAGSPAVALEWFPELGMLTLYDGGNGFAARMQTWNGSSWSFVNLPGTTFHGYEVFSRYSKPRALLYFGGGTVGGTALYTMNGSGTITRRADAPVSLAIGGGGGRLAVDPVTGNLLTFSSGTPGTGRTYEYNPDTNVWTNKAAHPMGDTNGQLICVETDIPAAGVVMFLHYAPEKVWLYRNTAGVGS